MATLPAQGSLRSRTAATVSSLTLRHISAARRCWPVPQSHSPRIFVPRADSVKCRSGRLIMWGRVIKRSRNADAVITGAGSGIGAAPQMAAYNVGKVGVLSVSETLAAELADRLMRWTGFSASVSPEHVSTPMTAATCTACRNSTPASAGTAKDSRHTSTPAQSVSHRKG